MPANRGGGPRKGKAGKKTQIEKMVETAKKSQPPQAKPKPVAPRPRVNNGSKKPNDTANGTSNQKLGDALNTTSPAGRTVNSTMQTHPMKCISRKLVTVRLPCQASVTVPKTMPIVYTQPAPVTAPLPQPFKNRNHVVVRLPVPQSSKEPTTFLSLPNEIRNAVYDLAMPRQKYGIQFIRDKRQRSTELTYYLPLSVTNSGPQLTAQDGQRRRLFDLPKRLYIDKVIPPYRLSPGPAALLLVSKDVNEDTTPILYGRNVFTFHSMQPMRKFLDTLSPKTRSMVRSLEIAHHTAGNPAETPNQIWKDIYDSTWNKLCFQIRDQCTGLASLVLDLTINDIPFDMGPLANWMSPLYAFMNLGHLKKLSLRLHQSFTDAAVLEVEAYEIRKELMGQNFYEPLTPMSRVFVEKPKPKARPTVNALRITGNLHNQPIHRSNQLPANRLAHMSTAELTQLPVHQLPNQRPSLGPRATVFWHPPSPTRDHPLYHKKGSRGEKEAIRKMDLQHKAERLEKKDMEKARKMAKSKAKA
ncbi:MAG: hypothetical protein LQ338_002857 [Usnochroma carphineum]|nr:MAG: hypothetical protein LQ338_002857 [Usnochroma carphineum]